MIVCVYIIGDVSMNLMQLQYSICVSPQHSNFEISDCGFFINPLCLTLGASPDGNISRDCHEIGTLETKWPYCSSDCTQETAAKCNKILFLERDDDSDSFKPKEDTVYYCDVQYGDFNVCTPHGINVNDFFPSRHF